MTLVFQVLMKYLISFLLDIFSCLTPELALAGGVPFAPRHEDKPSLWTFFTTPAAPAPPPPPPPPAPSTEIPKAPVPPPPPTPAIASSADIAAAQQQGAQQAGQGFGYQGSLLRPQRSAGGPTGPNGSVNSATGTGSLLGR